ncbi:putative PEP-binding protein, partial [Paenibacillus larvae]|uniref:putative PEP-binding protein n=1 Tax=Paenibacillus larvae TaxID=1464 RepID=UPI0039FD5044
DRLPLKPVVIRTLDIGGDKHLDYLALPEEENPSLGYRAIRVMLDRTDLFKTQLRAILRASHYGSVKIMYPMISSLEELHRA